MKRDRLRLNQLPDDAFAWYLGYLGAMDALDLDAYGRFLADDCVMGFNNEPPTEGKAAILGRLRGYWQSFTPSCWRCSTIMCGWTARW